MVTFKMLTHVSMLLLSLSLYSSAFASPYDTPVSRSIDMSQVLGSMGIGKGLSDHGKSNRRPRGYKISQTLASMSNMPDMPDLPRIPDMPNMPDLPHLPTMPDMPKIPDMPDLPEMPKLPNMPKTSSTPKFPFPIPRMGLPRPPNMRGNMPDMPKTPDTPNVPEYPFPIPQMGLPRPHRPDMPKTPDTPNVREDPFPIPQMGLPRPHRPDMPKTPDTPNVPHFPFPIPQMGLPRTPNMDLPHIPISLPQMGLPRLPNTGSNIPRMNMPGMPRVVGTQSTTVESKLTNADNVEANGKSKTQDYNECWTHLSSIANCVSNILSAYSIRKFDDISSVCCSAINTMTKDCHAKTLGSFHDQLFITTISKQCSNV